MEKKNQENDKKEFSWKKYFKDRKKTKKQQSYPIFKHFTGKEIFKILISCKKNDVIHVIDDQKSKFSIWKKE